MDFFKFSAPTGFTSMVLRNGQMIHGIKSANWTERYSDVGEFKFTGKLSSGLKETLPIGSLVSHTKTLELAIVENCEINEKTDEDPDVSISGRTFVSFLEQRIVGAYLARLNAGPSDYVITAEILPVQIRKLISKHLGPAAESPDIIPGLNVVSTGAGESVERTISKGPLLGEVLKLLPIFDLGIRTVRNNPFGVLGSPTETQIGIYKGADKSKKVIYSSRTGHLDSVDYLFTNKDEKNSALVIGRYVQVAYDTGLGYTKRQTVIDASDIDGHLDAFPTGLGLAMIQAKMTQRAQQELQHQAQVNVARADASSTDQYQYRVDYNLGDLVTVSASYGETEKMRIVEYVEIEDEEGYSGHPTFGFPL
jgi:hypothetical protein